MARLVRLRLQYSPRPMLLVLESPLISEFNREQLPVFGTLSRAYPINLRRTPDHGYRPNALNVMRTVTEA